MSRFKLIAFIALIMLAFGVALVGNALAGEKVKYRVVGYCTKWEPVNVVGEEGHIVGVFDGKGYSTNLERKAFLDGWLYSEQGLCDLNVKTGAFANQGYDEFTDKEGDKIYLAWQGKGTIARREGTIIIKRGTGKYEGIQGRGTWAGTGQGLQWYADCEWDVELPRR